MKKAQARRNSDGSDSEVISNLEYSYRPIHQIAWQCTKCIMGDKKDLKFLLSVDASSSVFYIYSPVTAPIMARLLGSQSITTMMRVTVSSIRLMILLLWALS